MRHYLRDPGFSHFDKIPECDRQTDRNTHTDRHTTKAYTVLSIALRSKNQRYSRNQTINVDDSLPPPTCYMFLYDGHFCVGWKLEL